MPYSNVEDVKRVTNIRPGDLGLEHEIDPSVALDEWIEARLAEISDLIDQHIAEEYQGESATPGIHGIARQMAQNLIANVRAGRSQNVVRIGEWRVQIEQARVFTQDVQDSLALYQVRKKLNIFRVPGWREYEKQSE